MKTIHKYNIPVPAFSSENRVVIQIPKFAWLLSVGMQNGLLYLWALIDTKEPFEEREFWVYGTGHEVKPLDQYDPLHRRHLGTVHGVEGWMVLHIFVSELEEA